MWLTEWWWYDNKANSDQLSWDWVWQKWNYSILLGLTTCLSNIAFIKYHWDKTYIVNVYESITLAKYPYTYKITHFTLASQAKLWADETLWLVRHHLFRYYSSSSAIASSIPWWYSSWSVSTWSKRSSLLGSWSLQRLHWFSINL